MQDERELIGKVLRGDGEAFGEVYDAYAARLYRYISFRIDQPQDAEDVLSSVFLKSFEALAAGRQVHRLRAFLYQSARNAIADYFRGKTRQQEYELRLDDDADAAGTESASTAVDAHIDLSRVREGLKKLKREYQEVIVLRYIEDLDIEEIAAAIGKSNVGVRVLLHRAIHALKKHLL